MRIHPSKLIIGIFGLLGALIVFALSLNLFGWDLSNYVLPVSLLIISLWVIINGGIKSVKMMIDSISHPTWRGILHVISLIIAVSGLVLGLLILVPMLQKIPTTSYLVGLTKQIVFLVATASIAEAVEDLIPK